MLRRGKSKRRTFRTLRQPHLTLAQLEPQLSRQARKKQHAERRYIWSLCTRRKAAAATTAGMKQEAIHPRTHQFGPSCELLVPPAQSFSSLYVVRISRRINSTRYPAAVLATTAPVHAVNRRSPGSLASSTTAAVLRGCVFFFECMLFFCSAASQ